jgi:hypothetical protein
MILYTTCKSVIVVYLLVGKLRDNQSLLYVWVMILYLSYEWVSDCCLTSSEQIPYNPVFALTPQSYVLRGETAHTNIIVFGLTQPRLEPITYRPLDENA